MPEPLKEFYAVTKTSIYHVEAHGPWVASAKKIALKGDSAFPTGMDIAEGGMIAVGTALQAYIPEKYGMSHPMTGYERNPMLINTQYWGCRTSGIIGLFKDKDAAMPCFNADNQELCDPRWIESTLQVLEEIGDEHPSFFVHHNDEFDLRKPKKAA